MKMLEFICKVCLLKVFEGGKSLESVNSLLQKGAKYLIGDVNKKVNFEKIGSKKWGITCIGVFTAPGHKQIILIPC